MITRLSGASPAIPQATTKYSVSITRKDIEYIAHLALEQADTADLVPMAHPLDMTQRLRADEVTATDERDRYQQNATETRDGLYIVPRVVE